MNKLTFECRKHELKFEYPLDWDKAGLPGPACSLCKEEENTKINIKYIEVKQHRDKLLAAIEIKLNIKSDTL